MLSHTGELKWRNLTWNMLNPKEREGQTYLLWALSTDFIEEHKSTEEPIDLVIFTKYFIQFLKDTDQLIGPDVLTKAITNELRLEGSLLRIYFIF